MASDSASSLAAAMPAWLQALRALAWAGGGLCALLALLWGAGALWYQWEARPALLWPLLVLWGLAWLALALLAWHHQHLGLLWGGGALLMALLLAWWATITPRADRDWADDVARITRMQAAGSGADIVALQDVRNFAWRSETDYTARWEDRRYDLNQLRSVDMAVSYWMGPAIAHTLVSFGFENGEQLVFSFEIRKEKGEAFDALAGFFKRYELALIAADERDILAVRTNVRGEQVFLYRVDMPQPAMRAAAFLCRTGRRAAPPAALVPHADRQLHHHRLGHGPAPGGRPAAGLAAAGLGLSARIPGIGGRSHARPAVEQLRAAGDITQRAQQWQAPAGSDDRTASIDFSRAIRAGIPPLQP
jgi:hypothetical protein